ncbi:MAG: hypothetical protein ACYC5F_06150 [Thermoleophilia bacterium]
MLDNDRTSGGWFKAGFFFALGAMCAVILPNILLALYFVYLLSIIKK